MPSFTISFRLRPCLAHGERALFHRWDIDDFDTAVAIVEYEDGTMDSVYPDNLRFLDSKATFAEYAWTDVNHERTTRKEG